MRAPSGPVLEATAERSVKALAGDKGTGAVVPSNGVRRAKGALDPILVMLAAIAVAVALTWLVPSGRFDRDSNGVLPGTYHVVSKPLLPELLIVEREGSEAAAYPASLSRIVTAQPAGMKRSAGLIVMILFLGGMFGVLDRSGALDAAIDRLVEITGGQHLLIVPVLMLAVSAGSAFLGLAAEYLLIIPVTVSLAGRLGRSPLFGLAIVTVASKIGFLASVANPVALLVAQPLAGVPLFSGWWLRAVIWLLLLTIGTGAVLRLGRRVGDHTGISLHGSPPLPLRQKLVVLSLAASVVAVVIGSTSLGWRDEALGSFYIALAILIACIGGIGPRTAAQAFLDGMRRILLAAVLVGMASAIEVVLRDGLVLDTIVETLSSLAGRGAPWLVAQGLMGTEMVLTCLVSSTSAKAALSMPLLVPIAHLNGITGQTTVLAFLLGNGLVNMVSPTSGTLLAYLAAAGVSYGTWLRFILPVWVIMTLVCSASMAVAVNLGY